MKLIKDDMEKMCSVYDLLKDHADFSIMKHCPDCGEKNDFSKLQARKFDIKEKTRAESPKIKDLKE